MNSEEAAQRAAACWNACEGIPDLALKPGLLAEQGMEVQQLLRKVEHFQQLAEHRGRSIDNLLNTQGRMSTLNDQLVAALEKYEDAHSDLFGQCCSNPVTNAWGKQVNMAKLNDAHEAAGPAIAAAKGGAAVKPAFVRTGLGGTAGVADITLPDGTGIDFDPRKGGAA